MPLAVLIFFSIASVKRDDYILPALPGIAILCASVFTLGTRGAASKLRDLIVVVFALGSIAVLPALFLFPSLVLPLFLAQRPSATENLTLAYDGFALLGVHATSVGLFTLFALMIGDASARRRLARAFVVFLGAWCATLVWNTHETPSAYGRWPRDTAICTAPPPSTSSPSAASSDLTKPVMVPAPGRRRIAIAQKGSAM